MASAQGERKKFEDIRSLCAIKTLGGWGLASFYISALSNSETGQCHGIAVSLVCAPVHVALQYKGRGTSEVIDRVAVSSIGPSSDHVSAIMHKLSCRFHSSSQSSCTKYTVSIVAWIVGV
jgi:hypothetical protein